MHKLKDKLSKKDKAPQGTRVELERTVGQSTEPQSTSDLVVPQEPEDPDGLGLKVWNEPSVADGPLVDIVFVHGLTGKRTKTWLADGAARPWPQELLAKQIPEARILTYGYDADVVHFFKPVGQNTVREHARNLMGDLTNRRRESFSLQRPLIFVAHSLGGLICEEAIVLSSQHFEEEHQIFDSLHGIMFLGTPHAGSDLSTLALALGVTIKGSLVKSLNTSNIAVLKKDSEVLAAIQESFSTAITRRERADKKRVEIHSCTEEHPIKGSGHRVVESNSARFPGFQTSDTIPADHMSMTKFHKSSQVGYERISGRLWKWVDDIRKNPDSPPDNPIFLMPFAQDKDFVGREDTLRSIEQGFSQSTTLRRIALAGLGGVGKSQIAIEYAYRLRKKQPGTSLFWVSANSAARFELSYRSIASTAKIPGIEDPKSDVRQLVKQWLSSSESGAWLLILDNADDAELFFGPLATQAGTGVESPLLSRFLPQTGTGSILITSRDRGAAFDLTGVQNQVLPIDVMSKDDTLALLTKKLAEDPSDRSVKEELIAELDLVPLAITQASAYITAHAPRMTVLNYLQLLRHNDQNQVQILSNNKADLRRDAEVPHSVIITWQLSFSKIKSQNPEAADLLSCMCMLDRQGIPEFLICEDGEPSLLFEGAIAVLTRFSFVKGEKDQKIFAIHRLVQLATRKWIETSGDLEKFQKEALRLVYNQIADGTDETWTIGEALEPHAQIVLDYIYDSKDCQLQQAAILRNRAWYAMTQGRLRNAEEMLHKAVHVNKLYLGLNDPEVLTDLSILALTNREQGRWREAEKLCAEILEVSRRILGAEHPTTMIAMNNLASTYHGQARWEEAEKLNMEMLEVSRRLLGAERPTTMIAMNNLASTYHGQERWTKAEKMQVQVLEVERRVLGAEHPATLRTMRNLASTYDSQARWKEAERLKIKTLEVSKRVLGAEHPDTLSNMCNLAHTYHNQNRQSEAIELMERVVELFEKSLGPEYPHTIGSMNMLACWYHEQNRHSEAIELKEKVVELSTKVLGPEHLDTTVSMGWLATWYYEQNRHSEAIELMERVVELERKSLGPEHPATLLSMHRLALLYHSQNRHSEAIEMIESIVGIRKKNLGPEHPDTIDSMDLLAEWKRAQSST